MPEVWGQIACFGINDRRGHLAYETFIWDADFPAVGSTVENAWENGLVHFQARSQDSPPLPGQAGPVLLYGEGGYNVMQPVLHSIQLEG